jgi:hypothetical protein
MPPPQPPIHPVGLLQPIAVLPQNDEKTLRDKVLSDVAKNMGIQANAVPADVQAVVDQQVKQNLTRHVQDLARELSNRATKDKLTQAVNVKDLMAERLKGAHTGIEFVSQNNDVKKIMDQNAKLLKMKFDSLQAVGFTADQAFQIVLTELAKPRR